MFNSLGEQLHRHPHATNIPPLSKQTSVLPESFRGWLDQKYSSSLFLRYPVGCWHPRSSVQMLALCCRSCIPWAAPSQCLAPMTSSTSRNRKMDWGRVWQALAWFIQRNWLQFFFYWIAVSRGLHKVSWKNHWALSTWSLCSVVLVECAQGVANVLRIEKNQETVLSSLLLRLLASLEFPVPVLLVDSFSKSLSPRLNSAVCGNQILPSLYFLSH